MKFEVGDDIALKSNAEEGKVVRILEKNMVVVRINNVEFPIFESEIEHPYFNWFINKKFAQAKSPKKYIDNIAVEKQKPKTLSSFGMHLVFMPVYKNLAEDDIIEKVKIYISNSQGQAYGFHYYYASSDGETFNFNSDVAAYSDFYLHDIAFEQMATNPFFELSFAEIISNIHSSINQFQESFTMKPKQLFKEIQLINDKNTGFFTRLLFNSQPHLSNFETILVQPWSKNEPKIVPSPVAKVKDTEKPIVFSKSEKSKSIDIELNQYFTNPFEIDLHIEKLYEMHQEMKGDEKIIFQLKIFQKALDNAILSGQTSLIIIHGIGKGRLKNEIHAILNQTKQVTSYVNDYNKCYGFGATEIFFS